MIGSTAGAAGVVRGMEDSAGDQGPAPLLLRARIWKRVSTPFSSPETE